MIKLFWNTHNQDEPNPNKTNEENARDQIWGLYHKDYSDKWIYEILNRIEFEVIQSEKDLEREDILIIVSSHITKFVIYRPRLLKNLKTLAS